MSKTDTEVSSLSFKYIRGTNLVEVWHLGELLKVVEIEESEFLLTNLMQVIDRKTIKSNVIERFNKSWWQKEASKNH